MIKGSDWIIVGVFFVLLLLIGALSYPYLYDHEKEPEQPRLIYLETQVYNVAGLDEDQYVMRWFDTETMRVIVVDVRGKENAERIRKEIER